jgi:hypothetical protein
MDPFEQLFAKAEIHGLIEQNIVSDKLSIAAKRQSLNLMREYDITQYCIEFRTYLNEMVNLSFETDLDYFEYCKEESTFETFVEFIHYRKAETKKNIIERAKETAQKARYSSEQIIAMEILGIMEYGENNYNPVKPNFKHIPDVLSKHNLSPDEALIYLNNHTDGLSPQTEINLISKVKENIEYLKKIGYKTPPQQGKAKAEQETPKIFEELFYNPEHAEPCLQILSELEPPVIDAINNYIGKAKGIFPLWVKVLKNHKPQPLMKHFKDTVYKDLLNKKVKGLNLTKDASEFRKEYKRLETNKIELDIKTILSQYSQSGKLG